MKILDQAVFGLCDSQHKWAAVDNDGTCVVFKEKPSLDADGSWQPVGGTEWHTVAAGYKATSEPLERLSAPAMPMAPSQAENWGQCAPPVMPTAPAAPALSPNYMARDWNAIFNGFGGNWWWASVDYRGVARVHTFHPEFTSTGRVAVPRPVGNSEPAPAFDVDVSSFPGWKPMVITRIHPVGTVLNCTDRFGVELPEGANPVEAADVVHLPVLPDIQAQPKYKPGDTVLARVPNGAWREAIVIALDGPLYVLRRDGAYAAFGLADMRDAPTEVEQFHDKVCQLLGWDHESDNGKRDAKKLFDAGCRL